MNAVFQAFMALSEDERAPVRRGEKVRFMMPNGTEHMGIGPEDILISTEQAAEWVCSDDADIQVAISTVLTPELIREGMSRDFVRQVQQLRKDANLNIHDRIRIEYHSADNTVQSMVAEWGEYIKGETLADSIEFSITPGADSRSVTVGDSQTQIWIVTLV